LNSAGALDSGKPVEKPDAHRAGDVENHFADFYLNFTVRGSRCHDCVTPDQVVVGGSELLHFLDRHSALCYQNPSLALQSNRRNGDEKLKSV
jgi:hypothetical protein